MEPCSLLALAKTIVSALHLPERGCAGRSRHPSLKALIDQIDTVRFSEGTNDFSYHPRYLLRAMKSLHLELTPT